MLLVEGSIVLVIQSSVSLINGLAEEVFQWGNAAHRASS